MVQKRSKTLEKPQKSPPEAESAPRGRGRPRQYDPERALANAAQVFWKHGYAATSLDDLVAATGMSRPSLYAAFGDKRDLYLKTLERYQQRSRAIGQEIIADDPPLRVFLGDSTMPRSISTWPREMRRAAAIRSRPRRRRRLPIRRCATSSPPASAVPTPLSAGRSSRRSSGARSHRKAVRGRWPRSQPPPCTRSRYARVSALRAKNSQRSPRPPSI